MSFRAQKIRFLVDFRFVSRHEKFLLGVLHGSQFLKHSKDIWQESRI